MTIADLIDYLAQFPPQTRVRLCADDGADNEDFVALDVLDYSNGGDK